MHVLLQAEVLLAVQLTEAVATERLSGVQVPGVAVFALRAATVVSRATTTVVY